MPFQFWKVLHVEYGIVVYPSALSDDIDVAGLGVDVTFTEAYHGHVGWFSFPFPVRSICIKLYADIWRQ